MRRFALILALVLAPISALAGPLPDPVSDTVNDGANVLSPAVEAQLATTLADARRETGVHVVVVTMNDHANFGGEGQSIETYATNLFNDWGIGDGGRNDGVLILVTPGRRAMRIELGRGFGGDWDETAKGIIDDTFLPAFAEGQIENGIRRGTDQVVTRIARPFARGEQAASGLPFVAVAMICIFAAMFIAIPAAGIIWVTRSWFGDRFARFQRCPSCGARGLNREHPIDLAATRTAAGQGTTVTRCNHCDYLDRQLWVIPMIRDTDHSSGNSGDSGFGGGGSSGGGGTGRW